MIGFIAAIGIAVVGVAGFLAGLSVGQSRSRLTPRDVRLYRRAGDILRQLIAVTSIDSEFNILTARTRQQVTDWVADSERELTR